MALQQLEHADDLMDDCLDNCLEAVQVCEWCADACVDEGEEMTEQRIASSWSRDGTFLATTA